MLESSDEDLNNTLLTSNEGSISDHNDRDLYRCSCCQKPFVNKYLSDKHLHSAHEKRRFLCTQCPDTFAYRSGRTRHIQSQHQKYRYVCKLCCALYSSRETAQTHVRQKHRAVADVIEKNVSSMLNKSSSIDDYVVKRSYNITEIKRIGKLIGCDLFKMEIGSVTSDTDGISKFCPKHEICTPVEGFTQRSNSNESVQNYSHAEDTSFVNDRTSPQTMNQNKQSVVSGLGEQYKLSEVHHSMETTLNVKSRWKCSMCEKSFAYNAGRSKHIRSVHRKIRYRCNVCTCLYTSKDYAFQHLLSAHSIKDSAISFITQVVAPEKNDPNVDQVAKLNKSDSHPNFDTNTSISIGDKCEDSEVVKAEDKNCGDIIDNTSENSYDRIGASASNCSGADVTSSTGFSISSNNGIRLPTDFQEKHLPLSLLLSVSQFWPLAVNYSNANAASYPATPNLPFHCLQCGIGFSSQDLLAQHVDLSHSIMSNQSADGSLEDDLTALVCGVREPRMLRCLYCGVTVLRPASLIGHMKSKHADMSYACAICRHIFQCPTLASYHIEKEHLCDPARVLLHVPSSIAQFNATS